MLRLRWNHNITLSINTAVPWITMLAEWRTCCVARTPRSNASGRPKISAVVTDQCVDYRRWRSALLPQYTFVRVVSYQVCPIWHMSYSCNRIWWIRPSVKRYTCMYILYVYEYMFEYICARKLKYSCFVLLIRERSLCFPSNVMSFLARVLRLIIKYSSLYCIYT